MIQSFGKLTSICQTKSCLISSQQNRKNAVHMTQDFTITIVLDLTPKISTHEILYPNIRL